MIAFRKSLKLGRPNVYPVLAYIMVWVCLFVCAYIWTIYHQYDVLTRSNQEMSDKIVGLNSNLAALQQENKKLRAPIDFDGEVQKLTKEYAKANPDLGGGISQAEVVWVNQKLKEEGIPLTINPQFNRPQTVVRNGMFNFQNLGAGSKITANDNTYYAAPTIPPKKETKPPQ